MAKGLRTACALVVTVIVAAVPAVLADAAGPCDAPANAIVAENCLPGTQPAEWDIAGAGDGSVEGFATDISVDQGQTVAFKIEASQAYQLEIFRLGYYGGLGARRVATVGQFGAQDQPDCLGDGDTGLVDCANWQGSTSWSVPASATSGIYLAVAVRNGVPVGHVPFIVRDDDGRSDLLFQTSDTTWHAYNQYGGNSLYVGSPAGRAYEVSYNRPFLTASDAPEDWIFNAEYPMVRWLERNGYDVSYFTGVDSDRLGAEIREHRAFLSVGHDEYWSAGQRANVEAARDRGVSLAFFSGNEVFWKTRWENGHRTLVCYKETHAGAKIDPTGTWTGTWRDPRFSPPADGGRPENALTGQLFMVNDGATTAIEVPSADGKMRFWRNTSVATLADGATATMPDGTLGYEWDTDPDNGFRPAGSVRLSSTTVNGAPVLLDHGSTFGSGRAEHNMTLFRDTNGAGPDALVFGAGTVQWAWGLDEVHERGSAPASPAMQQATLNLFADMGVQPGTLQDGLQPAAPSSDTTPPSTAIAGPATFNVTAGVLNTIQGSASDSGGGRVGAVEVSTDGGQTWHPAIGRENWVYVWEPSRSGTVTPLARAADDSANLAGADQSTPPPPDDDPGPGGGEPGAGGGNPGAGGGSGRPGAGGKPGGGPSSTPDAGSARNVAVGPERVRMSRKGVVRLLVACEAGGEDCRVQLRMKRRGRTVAVKTRLVRSGDERTFALKLDRPTRRKLIRKHSLRVNVLAGSGGRTTRASIRLLAPRSLP
jgi:hypothetical protein